MALPEGVVEQEFVVGNDIEVDGSVLTGNFSISVEQEVIWSETGTRIYPKPSPYRVGHTPKSVFLANTSQDGFVNSEQEEIHGWRYVLTWGTGRDKRVVKFQLPATVGPVYLNKLVQESPGEPETLAYNGVLAVRINGTTLGPDGTGLVNLGTIEGGEGGGGPVNAGDGDIEDAGATGVSLVQSSTADQALTALGLSISTYVKTFLDDTTSGAALTTLGISTFVKTLVDDADAGAFLTTLGFSTFVKSLVDDGDASTFLSTLGVSTFMKTVLDDTSGDNALGTLGATSTGLNVVKAANQGAGRTALGATTVGSDLFTASNIASALATLNLSGLATTLANLQTQLDARMVYVPYISGVYVIPNGAGTTSPRKFTGPEDPEGNPEYDPEGRGDEWDGVSLP